MSEVAFNNASKGINDASSQRDNVHVRDARVTNKGGGGGPLVLRTLRAVAVTRKLAASRPPRRGKRQCEKQDPTPLLPPPHLEFESIAPRASQGHLAQSKKGRRKNKSKDLKHHSATEVPG